MTRSRGGVGQRFAATAGPQGTDARSQDLVSIVLGKLANFAILADNPATVDSIKIEDIEVGGTVQVARVLPVVSSVCAGNPEAPKAMTGSHATVPVTDAQILSAARFAVDAQQKALSAAGETAVLELVGVRAAEQQVVSGVDYRLELRAKWNGAEQTAEVVVWWQSWRKPDPYQLTSWAWR